MDLIQWDGPPKSESHFTFMKAIPDGGSETMEWIELDGIFLKKESASLHSMRNG